MCFVTKKLKLKLFSYNVKILNVLIDAINKETKGAFFLGPYRLPIERKVFCVLRSPFVNKDSRDHFEIKKYSVFFICKFRKTNNIIKFLKLIFKKLSFEISNNIFVQISQI